MDAEATERREPITEAGSGQGQPSGQTPPGGGQIHHGQAPAVFTKGQPVYIKWQGKKWSGSIVDTTTLNGATVYIVDPLHGSPFQVTAADLLDKQEEDQRIWNEKREEKKHEYAKLIELWNSGTTSNKDMAKALGTTASGAAAKINSSINWKLIDRKPTAHDEK